MPARRFSTAEGWSGRHGTSLVAQDDACVVGARLRAMLLLGGPSEQELSSAFGSRVTFSLRGQRESNQRERPPRLALAGLLPGKSVSRGRAFRAGSCPREKASPSMDSPAARPVDPDSPPHRGPDRAAGHPGPHFSKISRSKAKAPRVACSITRARVAEPIADRPLATHFSRWRESAFREDPCLQRLNSAAFEVTPFLRYQNGWRAKCPLQ